MSTDTTRRNDELYGRITQGDSLAISEMIEANIPLVKSKVEGFLTAFPHLEYLRDEMIGEGNLALCEAVNLMRTAKPIARPSGYLTAAILKGIGNFIDSELYTSDRTARRRRSNGDDQEQLCKVSNSDSVLGSLDYDPRPEAELLDLIQGCCESDEERAIVDLRIKGYVDDEIARQLDIPKTTVFMLRRGLYKRVLATGEVTPES